MFLKTVVILLSLLLVPQLWASSSRKLMIDSILERTLSKNSWTGLVNAAAYTPMPAKTLQLVELACDQLGQGKGTINMIENALGRLDDVALSRILGILFGDISICQSVFLPINRVHTRIDNWNSRKDVGRLGLKMDWKKEKLSNISQLSAFDSDILIWRQGDMHLRAGGYAGKGTAYVNPATAAEVAQMIKAQIVPPEDSRVAHSLVVDILYVRNNELSTQLAYEAAGILTQTMNVRMIEVDSWEKCWPDHLPASLRFAEGQIQQGTLVFNEWEQAGGTYVQMDWLSFTANGILYSGASERRRQARIALEKKSDNSPLAPRLRDAMRTQHLQIFAAGPERDNEKVTPRWLREVPKRVADLLE
ncbi:MAG: hypothetical protein WCG27_03280 [Pseudomonadota bacterium]